MTFSSESDEPEHLSKGVVIKSASVNFPSISANITNAEITNKKKKIFHVCDVEGCNAKFSRPWRLLSHKSSKHLGEKPFICNESGCNKKYTSSSHLRRHKATVHSLESPLKTIFKCTYPGCLLILKTNQNLKKHFRRAHEPKRFTCSVCPESFQKHSQLTRHTYSHTGEPPLRCQECETGFTRVAELKRHIRGKHKIHLCPIKGCAEVFRVWSLLRKHIPSHFRVEEYHCEHCSKTFGKKERIRQHIVRVHIPDRVIPVNTHKPPVFICDLCEKTFRHKGSVKRHIQSVHQGKTKNEEIPVKKVRAKRKDAGKPRQSVACALSGIHLPLALQAKIAQQDCDGESIVIQEIEQRQKILLEDFTL